MSLEELIGTFKVHEQELQQGEGLKREKSLALSSQKSKKVSLSRELVLRSSSKALKVDDSSNDEFEEELDEYELAFISRKIHKMWRKRVGPSGETSQEECPVKKKG